MPALRIPDSGLLLGSFSATTSKSGAEVPEVIGLALTDNAIEEMIKCVQNGKAIQLSLGEHPILSYGTKHHTLSTFSDPFTHELFRTTNSDNSSFDISSNSNIQPRAKTQFNSRIGQSVLGMKGLNMKPWQKPVVPASTKSKKDNNTASTDAALAALQNSLASEQAKKTENTTKIIDKALPVPGRRGGPPVKSTSKAKFLSQNNRSLGADASRSMPSSPALTGVGSPALGPTSVPLSQQQAEYAKAARKPVIHLLAVEPLTEKDIHNKVSDVSKNDLNQALRKVGDLNESTGKWELRRSFYKELDIHSFNYESSEDRQQAIDNAVKVYDKMRLSASDPEWDRLLIRSERGTGKCLSKLQAQIAQGPVSKGPKINVEKTDGSGRDTPSGKEEDWLSDKNLAKVKGGEGMARSSSQGPTAKAKKPSDKEALTKRLLSKNPSKAAAKSSAKSTPRAAPAKKQAPAKAATTSSKVLSSEFVQDSDDDDDHPPPPKPPAKVTKRPRDEEEHETSDSSVPLSKKARKEAPVTTHRVSDASQASRTTTSSHYSSTSSKTKNNSPQKSSPLASSPPTNASEFDNSSGDGRTSSSASPVHTSTNVTRSPIQKRHQKSSSVTSSSSSGSTRYLKPEVTDLARRFKMYYPKYEALHKEIELMVQGGRRDKKKEQDLFDMHARLEGMKKEIFAGIVEY